MTAQGLAPGQETCYSGGVLGTSGASDGSRRWAGYHAARELAWAPASEVADRLRPGGCCARGRACRGGGGGVGGRGGCRWAGAGEEGGGRPVRAGFGQGRVRGQ